jgi:hypothetical protein
MHARDRPSANWKALIEEGQLLEVPPRTVEERQAFGRWLVAAFSHCGLEPSFVAENTDVSTEDVDAMAYNQSHGTTKSGRRVVHEYVLGRLTHAGGSSITDTDAAAPTAIHEFLRGRIAEAAFFRPKDDLRCVIATVVKSARAEIVIQAWRLSCPVILDALGNLQVPIHIAISHTPNARSSLHGLMKRPNVAVYCDPERPNHNKTIVVDRRVLLTGSVNFNSGSGAYDENLLVTSRPELVMAYRSDFDAKRTRLLRVPA